MIFVSLLTGLLTCFASESKSLNIRIAKQIATSDVRAIDLIVETMAGHQEGEKWKRLPRDVSNSENNSRSSLLISCRTGRVIISNWGKDAAHFTTQVRVHSPAQMLNWNGKLYRQELIFIPGKQGCDVVNHLDIETYLDGLVNTEFNSKWATESVKAQVIVARTYALYQRDLARKAKRAYDLDSSTDDQVYDGFVKEDFVSSRAVDQTRGMVIKFNKKLFPTYYHSTCGGMTELPEIVWGTKSPVYKERVKCSHCESSPKFTWSVSLPVDELLKKLKFNWAQGVNIQLRTDSASGRVKLVTLMLGESVLKKLTGVEFRNLIGPDKLFSTHFDLIQSGSNIEFRGGGFGHGVGMCQWGTKKLGESGKTADEILKFYYPRAKISRF
ncbi:MAG: SpoIID/LytB domain-containing protein [Xanthomonadaceae bacterium]|nr:SpoIID/LytB domain-containing protein [Xanthomonadaceae bacterium]